MANHLYKPEARKNYLLTADLEGETLILDTETNRAAALNPSMSFIWRHCDGKTTVSQIAELFRQEMDTRIDEAVIWKSLKKLEKAKLLKEAVPIRTNMNFHSRRELIKLLGLGAGAVSIVLVPAPAAAASCIPFGLPCDMGQPPPCCPGSRCRASGFCG